MTRSCSTSMKPRQSQATLISHMYRITRGKLIPPFGTLGNFMSKKAVNPIFFRYWLHAQKQNFMARLWV
jgi:hypothetical protein